MGNSKKALHVAEKYQNTASTQPKWRCQNQRRVWGSPMCDFTSLSPWFRGSWHQIPDFQTLGRDKGCCYSQHRRQDKLHVCVIALPPVRTVWGEARTVRQDGVAQMDAAHAGGLHHSWETSSLGNPNLWSQAASKPVQTLPQRETLFLLLLLLFFSCYVRSDSLQPHELQHTRLPCPSLSTGVCSNSSPLSPWCHPVISTSVAPLLPLPSIFPSFRVFSLSRHFTSGGQSIGASASASVLPMNIQGLFPLGLIGLISLVSKGPSRVFSSTTVRKHQFFSAQSSLWANSHLYITTRKTRILARQTFVGKVMSLLFKYTD